LATFSTCFATTFYVASLAISSFCLTSHSTTNFASASTLALALSASIFYFFFDASFLFFRNFSLSLLFLSTDASSTSSIDPECIEVEVWGDFSSSSSYALFWASSLAFSSSAILPLR
jgi:hypothetical protein